MINEVHPSIHTIASLYSYCLKKVQAIWSKLNEDYTPNDVQAGTATVFRHAVKYVPIAYLAGDSQAADESVRERVDQVIELYEQALTLSLEKWRKIGRYNMDAVQAGAATIFIQFMNVVNPFEEDEVVESPEPRHSAVVPRSTR